MEAGVSNTKLRVEQIKSEDGFTSLSVDLEALRGQVKDIIGSADYKEEITGEYAKVQIVDLAAHLDASGASSLSVKQAANVIGAFSVNTDKFTIAAATGNTMVNGTFNAKGAADLDSTLNVDGAAVMKSTLSVTGSADFLAAVVARSTFNAVGAADLDSTLNVDGASDLHGAVKAYSTLEVDGESTLASAIIEDITAQHIMFAGAAHEVEGSANLKWDGTDLIVGSAKVSDLTATRVTFAGADGALMDDAKMTFAAGVLTVSGSTYSANASIAGNLTVNGNFVVEGDTVTQNVTTVTTEDSVITLNKNASSVPAAGAGIEFEVSGAVAGYVKTNGAGDMLIKAATGSELTLDVNAASTIAVAGNLTVESGPSYINQDVTTDAMPEFTKAKLSTLTASRLMASNGSKETVSADLYSWVAGTANQVNVADDADGSITLSLPQNIHSGASPTFVAATLSGLTASRLMASDASKATVSIDLINWVTGTANRVSVANDGDGSVTLSAPQDIHTGASPTFAAMNFGSYGAIVGVGGGVDLKLAAVTGSLKFDDSFRAASTFGQPLKLAGAAGEWTAIETAYGGELSLLAMLAAAAPSTNKRYVWTSASATGTDVVLSALDAATFPIGAASYQNGKSDVFVNGQLMAEGSGKDFEFAAPAGTDRVKIIFAFSLQSGDVVTLHRYPAA